jgi:uncharacterized membrane protein
MEKWIDPLLTFHMFSAFLWAGQLTTQLLLLVLVPSTLDRKNRERTALRHRTVFRWIGWPAMGVSVSLGLVLAALVGVDTRYENWISAKVAFVGLAVTVSIFMGREIRRLGEPDYEKPVFPLFGLLVLGILSISSILYIVFEKPF